MKKILIVDDHAIVRQGLKQILKDEFAFVTFGEVGSAAEAVEAVQDGVWDLVILDLFLPGRGGFEVLKEIKHIKPKLQVLVHSMHDEDEFAIRALRNGASAYICKTEPSIEILKAVHKLFAGGKYVSASLAEKLAEDISGDLESPDHETLSNREFSIMLLIAAGKTLTDIGNELSLSPKTVSTYRSRILDKMKFKSNADLIKYVLSHKLNES
ncbi:MAG: DNA-binding response regulator [Chlorobiaceae bacterium]|nr:DNA-binding response regulator [Chlorobiaceae bacterium]